MSIEMSIVSNFGMLQSEIKDFPPITQEIDQADFGSNAVEASPHKPVKFMPYAVSLGTSFMATRAAFHYNEHFEKMKRNKLNKNKPIRRRYFPKTSTLPLVLKNEVSSTFSESKSEAECIEEDNTDFLFIRFFKNVCPALFFNENGCDNPECEASHVTPDEAGNILQQQLLKSLFDNVIEVYNMVVCRFAPVHREKFLPAFANVFARNRKIRVWSQALKKMIRDCQEMNPFPGFDSIINALKQSGMTLVEAIKFLINNQHEFTSNQEATRAEIFRFIGNTGVDVLEFVDYMNRIQNEM